MDKELRKFVETALRAGLDISTIKKIKDQHREALAVISDPKEMFRQLLREMACNKVEVDVRGTTKRYLHKDDPDKKIWALSTPEMGPAPVGHTQYVGEICWQLVCLTRAMLEVAEDE